MISPNRPSRKALSDGIYDIILGQLIEGEIQAGAALNIDALAREFDVSQTPIREALARLEATGLVVRAALKGYHAAPLFTESQLVALMEARAVIEPTLAKLACAAVDSDFLVRLRASIEEMRALAGANDRHSYQLYRQADERFHDLIAEQAGNPFLVRSYQALEGHVQRFRLFGALGASDVSHAISEHEVIIAALEAGLAERSAEAMAQHIHNVAVRAQADRKAIAD